jgi:hypothetical protein
LNNFLGPEGDTVTVDEQLLNTEYLRPRKYGFMMRVDRIETPIQQGPKFPSAEQLVDEHSIFEQNGTPEFITKVTIL